MPDAFEKITPPLERVAVVPKQRIERDRSDEGRRTDGSSSKQSVRESFPTVSLTPATSTPEYAQGEPPDPVLTSVERILSEDLFDLYRGLPPIEQARFKEKGEETASKIRELVTHATVKAKEILKLIIAWLALIPGVNKFFLEQESKIKTDKLLELHKRETNNL